MKPKSKSQGFTKKSGIWNQAKQPDLMNAKNAPHFSTTHFKLSRIKTLHIVSYSPFHTDYISYSLNGTCCPPVSISRAVGEFSHLPKDTSAAAKAGVQTPNPPYSCAKVASKQQLTAKSINHRDYLKSEIIKKMLKKLKQ